MRLQPEAGQSRGMTMNTAELNRILRNEGPLIRAPNFFWTTRAAPIIPARLVSVVAAAAPLRPNRGIKSRFRRKSRGRGAHARAIEVFGMPLPLRTAARTEKSVRNVTPKIRVLRGAAAGGDREE